MDSFPRTANTAGRHLLFRALTHFLSPYLLLSFPYTLFSSQFLPFLHQSFLNSFNPSFLPLLPPSPGLTFFTLPASPPSLVSLPPHITSSFVPFLLLCSLPLPSTSTFFFFFLNSASPYFLHWDLLSSLNPFSLHPYLLLFFSTSLLVFSPKLISPSSFSLLHPSVLLSISLSITSSPIVFLAFFTTVIHIFIHIRSSLGVSILPKDTSTCRPGESNQRPSYNKMLALPLPLFPSFQH